jgi:excisionase family DNA binding protein
MKTDEDTFSLLSRTTITVAQAAKVLGISRSLAFRLANTGDLPTLKLGEFRRVSTSTLRRMLDIPPPEPRRASVAA